MPFRSQSQWRWAFANKKPWASEWARETPRSFAQLPAYSKKAVTRGNFSAGAGEVIGGNQCRDENGHFANCEEVQQDSSFEDALRNPGGSMANFQMASEYARLVENERKKIMRQAVRERLGLAEPKKTGSGKISPEERKRQAREQQKKNEANTHVSAGPGAQLGAALSAFADPDKPALLPNIIAYQLEQAGLVETNRFGRPYITAEGRAYISAARNGDLFAAEEAMMRAREAKMGKDEMELQRQEDELRQAEEEAFQQYIESIEGTPRERRIQLAQKRREQMLNQGKPKKKPKPSTSENTYGSGKVIAGTPKSTVKSIDIELDDVNMPHYVPEDVLRAMIVGVDLAKHVNIHSTAKEFAEKAMQGEPFSRGELQRLKSFHDSLDVAYATRESPTKSWIEQQIAGGVYGYQWADRILAEYERVMIRHKETNGDDRIPSSSASVEAIRGLDLQHYFKRGGSDAMIALARKIANRKELDEDEIRTMHSYLERNSGNRKDDWANPANPSVAYINWQLHGGDAGLSWSSAQLEKMRLKREKPSAEYANKTTVKAGKIADVNFSPPQGVRSAAKRGLELRSKFGRGGTAVGIARARDLSNGKSVSPQTIRRMHSFFARHAVDKRPGWSNPSNPSNGYIAHLLWGGDAGRAWASKVDRQLDSRERKKSYDETYKHGRHDQSSHGNRDGRSGGGGGGSASGGGVPRRDKPWPSMMSQGSGREPSRREAYSSGRALGGSGGMAGTPSTLNELPLVGSFLNLNKKPSNENRDEGDAGRSRAEDVVDALEQNRDRDDENAPPKNDKRESSNSSDTEEAPAVDEEYLKRLQNSKEMQKLARKLSKAKFEEEKAYDEYIKLRGEKGSNHPDVVKAKNDHEKAVARERAAKIEYEEAVEDKRIAAMTFGGGKRKKSVTSPQQWRRMGRLMAIKYQNNRNADVLTAVQQGQRLKGKNKPNNPSLWKQAIAEAKKKYRVYPSAYANGYAAQWYKERGGTWSTEKDLREWFDEKWVDLSRPKKGGGYEPCGRKTEGMSESEYRKKYPKCVPASRAARMSDEQKRSAIRRKRDDGLPKSGAPTMVSTITRP